MTAALVVVRERTVRPREYLLASRLRRFAWRHRKAVSALARRHPRLADLALSFPALLFALAVPRPRFDPDPVIERIVAGAPLSELARDAGIPMWTRKLMPEAFLHPLPPLPDGDIFRRQIANHLPRTPKDANAWLDAASQAFVWGDEAIAIWAARHFASRDQRHALRHWRLLCLWAWHASHPEAPASRYLAVRWSPEISPKQALEAARDWTVSALALAEMGEMKIADTWGEPAIVDGFAFDPVLDADQLIEHARSLDNCVRSYAYGLAWGSSRLWAIRQDGKPVGMLHLEAGGADPYPTLGEISGRSGKAVSAEAVRAAHRWYRIHVPMRATKRDAGTYPRHENWRRIWRAYWLAKQRIPDWLPLQYEWQGWNRLRNVDWTARRRRRR